MCHEISESPKQILETELTPAMLTKFRALQREAVDVNRILRERGLMNDDFIAAAAQLDQIIRREVAANPILARTGLLEGEVSLPLIEILRMKVGERCYETIQFLIEMNPHALLWKVRYGDHSGDDESSDDEGNWNYHRYVDPPIHNLARFGWSCKIVTWIAERYPWVLQHRFCQRNPLHFEMMRLFNKGKCDLETIWKFYKFYPQGLRERRSGIYPLKASLEVAGEPNAEFFIWMAKQYPDAVDKSCSVLHLVCNSISSKPRDGNETRSEGKHNTAKICRFLISEHPLLVRTRGSGQMLPIHRLVDSCNRPLVQEMVILLLKSYPECVRLNSIHPASVSACYKEVEIDQDMSLLAQVSQSLTKAAVLSTYYSHSTNTSVRHTSTMSLLNDLAEVYRSWANLRSNVLSAQKERIQESIADVCRLFECDDVSDEDEEDVSEEDDENEWDEDRYSVGEGLSDEVEDEWVTDTGSATGPMSEGCDDSDDDRDSAGEGLSDEVEDEWVTDTGSASGPMGEGCDDSDDDSEDDCRSEDYAYVADRKEDDDNDGIREGNNCKQEVVSARESIGGQKRKR